MDVFELLINPAVTQGVAAALALGAFVRWEAQDRPEWARDESVSVPAERATVYRGAEADRVYRCKARHPRAPQIVRAVAALSLLSAASVIALGGWMVCFVALAMMSLSSLVFIALAVGCLFFLPGVGQVRWARQLLQARPSSLRGSAPWTALIGTLAAVPAGLFLWRFADIPFGAPALLCSATLPVAALLPLRDAREQVAALWVERGYVREHLPHMDPPPRYSLAASSDAADSERKGAVHNSGRFTPSSTHARITS